MRTSPACSTTYQSSDAGACIANTPAFEGADESGTTGMIFRGGIVGACFEWPDLPRLAEAAVTVNGDVDLQATLSRVESSRAYCASRCGASAISARPRTRPSTT